MKYAMCVLVWVAACADVSGEIDDPRTYALESDGGACDARQAARADVLARLGIDESACEPRSVDVDACADDVPAASPGTLTLTYAPYMTGTSVQVRREPGGGWWSIVCSCTGCSGLLAYESGNWPARISANGTGQTFLF